MAVQETIQEIKNAIFAAVSAAASEGRLKPKEPGASPLPEGFDASKVSVEPPRDKSFGDMSSNVAMKICKYYAMSPMDLASAVASGIANPLFSKVEFKAPGFINFYISDDAVYEHSIGILKQNENFGNINLGQGMPVNVEFGSINPTGPISVSHGRQVVLGDIFSSMLEHAGYRVTREYYCNDTGNQIYNLGKSVLARYREALGEKVEFPEDGYHGEYVMELAKMLIDKIGEKYRAAGEKDEEAIAEFGEFSQKIMIKEILDVCGRMGVKYDVVYSEKSLYEGDMVPKTLEFLKANELTYVKDDATWFRSTKFADDKDRVIIKSDGRNTYALSDIAYHKSKYDRGFKLLITFLGADHHGYTQRLYAAIQSLGYSKDTLKILIHQFVTMLRDGQVVRMSKRAANYVELAELLSDAGVDATRYFFIMRKMDAHLEFDINLAKSQTTDNPVYYLQYCHARCHGIIGEARNRGHETSLDAIASLPVSTLKRLQSPEEIDILKKACELPKVLEDAVKTFGPHMMCHYAEDFVKLFQSFYTKGKNDSGFRIVTDDRELTQARLALMYVVLITIRNVLRMLGVNAPERM